MEIILPGVASTLGPLRKAKKLKQRELAELLNCTVQHYQRMEYGKVNLQSTTLIFLADYLGVTADYLLGREKNPAEER